MLSVGVPWGYSLQTRGALFTAIQVLAWLVFLTLWGIIFATDAKEKKILHRHLLLGAGFAAVCYGVMLSGTALGALGHARFYYRWHFYRDLLFHAALSAAAALALWRARVWPAGDAKLFVLLALVFPMMPTQAPFHSGWLFLFLLINIFVPASAALFVQAARFVWSNRLRTYAGFLSDLARARWRVAADYLLQQGGAAAKTFWRYLVETAEEARDNPREAAGRAAEWVFSMFLMAVLSSCLRDVLASMIVRTLFCFAVLLLWGRLERWIGGAWSWACGVALVVLAVSGLLPVRWPDVWRSFGAISFFSVFLFIGIRSALGGLGGQLAAFAFPFIGLLLGGVVSALATAVSRGWTGLGAAWEAGWLRGAIGLACLGLFFGLSFVLVRVWDEEDHPDIPRDKILSYMVLHPSFVDKLREDEEFFAEHFESALYADGLTVAQAEALRGWCERRQVPSVPLAHTLPFAHWIFLGFFITWLIGGQVLGALL